MSGLLDSAWTVTIVPAYSKTRSSSSVSPTARSFVRPMTMRCSPPGSSVTDPPAGMSIPSIGCIPVIPDASVDVSWSSTDAASGLDAETRVSAALPVLVIVRYAAVSAPAVPGRAHASAVVNDPLELLQAIRPAARTTVAARVATRCDTGVLEA